MEKLIFTSIDKKRYAKKLAKALIKRSLAACVQIHKAHSLYIWQDKMQDEKEWILAIKTAKKFKKLKAFIKSHHHYDTAEIISFKIDKIDKKYQKWLKGK